VGNLGFETKEVEIAALFGRRHPKLAKREVEPGINAEEDGLLRVRMGTFEDSGKCKGYVYLTSTPEPCSRRIPPRFAFVDFKDQQFATDALTNPHNHSLNGRALVVEYASADAVRRGILANARKENENQPTKNRSSRRPQKSERIAAKATARQSLTSQNGTQADDPEKKNICEDTGFDENSRVKDPRKARDGPGAHLVRRQKSGAALATAQREKVSIVPSTGKKIVF
jgi:RNA recognition motif-containing protein